MADDLGGVDVFVNNAGTGESTLFVDLDLETWRRTVTTWPAQVSSATTGDASEFARRAAALHRAASVGGGGLTRPSGSRMSRHGADTRPKPS